jgi:8-oxo-dGTP pyrophosphatase MutT (NUDIX family)
MAALVTYEYRGISFIAGNETIDDQKMNAIIDSPKIKEWCNVQLDNGVIHTEKVVIKDVKFFGPVAPERVGFVVLEGTATEVESGKPVVASYAFVRGGSVAVFVRVSVITNRGVDDYAVFTDQIRYPMGGKLQEICAGCVDAKTNDVKGVAISELEEELGIKVNVDDLTPLGSIVPSGGGTYETIDLFYLQVTLTEEEVGEKIAKSFGEETGENIRLVFVPYSDVDSFLDMTGDVKAECAWRRIQFRGL